MANIQDATYNFKAVPEASWLALGTAIGGIVGSLLAAFTDIDPSALAGITAAIAILPRTLIGILLPAPPTTGAQGDKST